MGAFSQTDESYMRLAIEQARQAYDHAEVPIGAIVVYEPIDKATRRALATPEVIAEAYNLRETLNDPTAHAELLAIQKASECLDAWRLSDCTVYVTLEPCIMCAGLMHQARITRCVFGAFDPKAGALSSLYEIASDTRLNHNFIVEGGCLENECSGLLKSFFKERRSKK